MVKPNLRVKLVERKVEGKQKVARWRENVRTDDPERWSSLKKRDTERKKLEYLDMKEKQLKGD